MTHSVTRTKPGPPMAAQQAIDAFRLQRKFCEGLGSPFYGRLLAVGLDDLEQRGPLWQLIRDWSGDPLADFLPLRVLGAVHGLVLAGGAPDLARHYPSAGGRPDDATVGSAFLAAIEASRDQLLPALDNFPQTNEVSRAAGLFLGLQHLAGRGGRRVHLLEIGSSAGLNLLLDRFGYELGEHRLGDPNSPVRVRAEWVGAAPPGGSPFRVASRAGCDLDPLDVCDPADALRLESFVWADDLERLSRLRAAIELARKDPPQLERARAGQWLPARLAPPLPEGWTAVVHSAVWAYLPPEEQQEVVASIRAAGARASERAPLAWVRVEEGELLPELRVSHWPGGREACLAWGHPHGRVLHWRPT